MRHTRLLLLPEPFNTKVREGWVLPLWATRLSAAHLEWIPLAFSRRGHHTGAEVMDYNTETLLISNIDKETAAEVRS